MLQFEQWENVKFCQKLGKSASKMYQMMKQAYIEDALGHSAEFKWHKHFVQGREDLEDDELSELISRSKTVTTVTLVYANRSQMVDEIVTAAGINHDTCHKILSDDLNMSSVT
jgi:hypothetical protein